MSDEKMSEVEFTEGQKKIFEAFESIKNEYGDKFPALVIATLYRNRQQEKALVEIIRTLKRIGKGFSAMKAVFHIQKVLKSYNAIESDIDK